MAIAAPDQPDIDLGKSRIKPMDTYAPPAKTSAGMSGGSELGNALAQLGGKFESLGSDLTNKQNALDGQQTEYYAGQIRADIKSGAPVDTQVGALLPWQSTANRARVAENLGFDAGKTWATAEMEKVQQDENLRLNPDAMNARIADIRQQAAAMTKGDPGHGSGFMKATEGVIGQMGAAAQAQRAAEYETIQKKGYYNDWVEGTGQAAQKSAMPAADAPYKPVGDLNNVPYLASMAIRASEGKASISGLNDAFAQRLNTMMGDMPANLRSNVTIDSAHRSNEHQTQIYNEAVQKYGSEAEARKWAAPPGHSMHNHGEAVDLGMKSNPEAQAWVHANAAKYGLYFPMAHEPWHIEMQGGYRQTQGSGPGYVGANAQVGAGGSDTPVQKAGSNTTDGPSNVSPVESVVQKIAYAESRNNPNAQNPNSSAGGVGQFTDGTWLSSVRKYRPEMSGKSDDQILAMKKDGDFNTQILRAFTLDNAGKLQEQGLAVNPASLYLMHFAGEGDAPKVLKADDNTPVSKVMQQASLDANPQIANMTVGQLKGWAADKMNTSGPDGAARNSARQLDATYARSSSLGEQVRRDTIIQGVIKHSTETGDTKQIDRIPQEWLKPADRDRLEQAKRMAQDVQYSRFEKIQHMQAQARAEETRGLMGGIDKKLVTGQQVDPVKDALNKDGSVNHEALHYAREQENANLALSDLTSKTNASKMQDQIMTAAATSDWGKLDTKFKGKDVRTDDLRDYLQSRSGLKSSEKQELIAKLPQIIDASNLSISPTAKEYQGRTTDFAKALQTNPLYSKLAQISSVNFQGEAEKFFQAEVRNRIRASMEDGEVPRGEKARLIFETASDRTQAHLQQLAKLIGEGKDTSGVAVMGKDTETAKSNQAAAPQYQVVTTADGRKVIQPVNPTTPTVAPTVTNRDTPKATPTSASAQAPASPATEVMSGGGGMPIPPSAAHLSPPVAPTVQPSKPMVQPTPEAPTKAAALGKTFMERLEDFVVGKPEDVIARHKRSDAAGEGSVLGDAVIAHQMDRLKRKHALEAEAQRLRDANKEK